jgi:hypothetical protein
MRTSALILILAAVLTLARGTAIAQYEWAHVKSWAGSVTIEATDAQKGELGSSTMTYKATGDFTISDNMLPDGAHMQWPMPSAEEMSDPKRAAAAYERWQSRVVAKFEFKGINELGQPFTVTCTADNPQPTMISVAVDPTKTEYVVAVTAPRALFKCSGPEVARPNGSLRQETFELRGPRGAPGRINGTKTFTVGTSTIKVTYTMAPSK